MEAEAAPGTATASTSSITMTSTTNTASVNLLPTDSNGTFASSSASELASFDVATNNYTGYTLSISASDDTKKLISSTVSGAYLDSITSTISET
ncbi:hypothetical protein J6S55_02685, partial [Candidatus Saccharibacteria bacterium]|nr:hypothetical protein [Candidatus Saccharibacteria bacterium]